MKVLQLVTKRQFRGAEVFAANLSKELIKKDITVVFAGLYSPPTEPLKVEGALNIDLKGIKSKYISLSLLFSLIRLMYREKPDIIQANGSDTLKYAAFIKMFMPNIPIIYRNISIISTWLNENKIKQVIYKRLFNKIDHITCVGEIARDDFITTFGFDQERVTVIRRGIPALVVNKGAAREALNLKYNLSNEDNIVVHVGNFSPEKNHSFLIDVFQKIKQIDSTIKLLLLGEGVLERQIKDKVTKSNLADTVFFGGFTSNVQEIVAGCDLFALCSTIEGVPGVVLEAAVQKVPTVAVNVGGVGEVVINGETGVLIPNHDINLFAESILDLIKNKEKRIELANNAYTFAQKNYDSTINSHNFITLYDSMISIYNKRKKI